MKHNRLLISGSILAAAWMTSGVAFSQTSGSKSEKINPDVSGSKGGSQSERTGESGVPLPKGSPSSGTVEKGKSADTGSAASGRGHASMTNVKEVQQALKAKGYDPGPIDGVMGGKTKEALKSFQSASNIKSTGTLDSETSQKLGVQAAGSASMPRTETKKSDSNTTVGKDTDQPNQPG